MSYPPIWGTITWHVIHYLVYAYPENPSKTKQDEMEKWLLNLCPLLPCSGCKNHCSDYLKNYPPPVSDKRNLWNWSIDFHNAVNERTGKRKLTYDEAEQIFKDRFLLRENAFKIQDINNKRKEDHTVINNLNNKLTKSKKYTDTIIIILTVLIFILCLFMLLV